MGLDELEGFPVSEVSPHGEAVAITWFFVRKKSSPSEIAGVAMHGSPNGFWEMLSKAGPDFTT
jgi:hypothetical protein